MVNMYADVKCNHDSLLFNGSDDTFKLKSGLGFHRWQQLSLSLWCEVFQVMPAPNWGG